MNPTSKPACGLAPVCLLARLGFVLACPVLLSGCHDADLEALRHEIETMKNAPPGVEAAARKIAITPDIPTRHVFDGDRRSPFETPDQQSQPAVIPPPGLPPGEQKPAEPLQAFALDELILAGTLTFDGKSSALVRDPAGTLHRVSLGDRMGKHRGRITEITASAVQLMETVPAANGWEERVSTMTLED